MNPGVRTSSRSLAGTTILQVVPALHDEPAGHAAVGIAFMLLQSGARAIVAGGEGALVKELCAFGSEWVPMINDTINPLRIRQNARQLANISALALDVTAFQALAARARQFAEFAFSTQSVADAVRGVYTSLLIRDR
jgi:hypothetical protein